MQSLITILHVLITLSIIGLVLLQHGKGADMGASFGSGAANTMFGSSGPAPFLMKLTGGLAVLFFITSIGLSWLSSRETHSSMLLSAPPVHSIPVKTDAPNIPQLAPPQVPAPADKQESKK